MDVVAVAVEGAVLAGLAREVDLNGTGIGQDRPSHVGRRQTIRNLVLVQAESVDGLVKMIVEISEWKLIFSQCKRNRNVLFIYGYNMEMQSKLSSIVKPFFLNYIIA